MPFAERLEGVQQADYPNQLVVVERDGGLIELVLFELKSPDFRFQHRPEAQLLWPNHRPRHY